MLFVSSEVI